LVCACLVLAASVADAEVTTIEGLAPSGSALSDVQQAFVDAGAVQCGFCTPGLIMAIDDLLARDPEPAELTVREAISGNLCRCTGYGRILDAVVVTVARRRTTGSGTAGSGTAASGGAPS
jgi:carbon-monoxide dehydrogenase small subunit